MPLDEDDAGYLMDMLLAARSVQRFVKGLPAAAFAEDELHRMAVERAFEVIGEAARSLSEDFRAAPSGLPLRAMIGLRNVIAHGYADIDHRRLHHIATVDVPDMVRILESLLPEDLES
jgi:uncharacterized protein with HEPN domain